MLFDALARDAHQEGGAWRVARVWMNTLIDLVVESVRFRLRPPASASRYSSRSPARTEGLVLDTIVMDLRHALRMIRRQPGLAALVTIVLGLGVGANTAIFSVVRGVVLRPLPYEDPGNLYQFIVTFVADGESGDRTSYPDFVDWRDRTTGIVAATAYAEWSPILTGGDTPVRLNGMRVSGNLFSFLGVSPAVGRSLAPEDDRAGRADVVMLGHAFWQSRFGGDTTVVGRSIHLDGRAHVVVGIGPAALADRLPGLGAGQVYRPLGFDGLPEEDVPYRGGQFLYALARLDAGLPVEKVRQELDAVSRQMEVEYPRTNDGKRLRLEPFHAHVVGEARSVLALFAGAVVLVLLIAVANVTNVLLGRAVLRRREMALRAALGAGYARLVRQLVTESLVLAMMGAGLGAMIAAFVVGQIPAWGGGSVPLASEIRLDVPVLLFAVLVAGLTGVLVGVVPAMHAVRSDLQVSLKADGDARGTSGRMGTRLRTGLVSAEVAIAVTLLSGAGLLARSFWALYQVDPGFDTGVATFTLRLPEATYPHPADAERFFDDLFARIRTMPGVERVATVSGLPMSGISTCGTLATFDDPDRFAGGDTCAEVRAISPEYFQVMGIPIVGGRGLMSSDHESAPDVVVISRPTGHLLWPGQSPLGKRVMTGIGGRYHEVVGVVPAVKQFGLDRVAPPQTYLPRSQWHRNRYAVVVRHAADASVLLPALRAAVWEIDRQLPVDALGTVQDFVDRTVVAPRFRTRLIAAFAALAFVLAMVGIYGVVGFTVSQRLREIAIRMSLGADPFRVRRLVCLQALRPVLFGGAVGVVVALVAARAARGLLFGISPSDPVSFLAVVAATVTVATVAAFIPAARATRVDPVTALRSD
jgi:putative ABC transport system permease protein